MELYFRELPCTGSDKGNPVIILHGLFGSSDNWLTVSKKIAERHHVYLVDQRNHGRSEKSDVFTYDAMAEDVREFILKHGIYNPIIIGHSMGGKVAMQFALRHPAMYDKLIVVDIAPRPYKVHHDKILEGLNKIDLEALKGREEADQILSEYEPDFGTRQFLLKSLYRNEEGKYDWRINLAVITRDISHIVDSLHYEAPNHEPILFIRGAKSRYIEPGSDTPMIKTIFPQAEIVTIEGAGHWVHAEKPQEFLEAVSEFID